MWLESLGTVLSLFQAGSGQEFDVMPIVTIVQPPTRIAARPNGFLATQRRGLCCATSRSSIDRLYMIPFAGK
jgi:hypothetical protein